MHFPLAACASHVLNSQCLGGCTSGPHVAEHSDLHGGGAAGGSGGGCGGLMRCGRGWAPGGRAPPPLPSCGATQSQSSGGGGGAGPGGGACEWHSHWSHVKLALTSSALPSSRVTVTIHSTPMVCSWYVGPKRWSYGPEFGSHTWSVPSGSFWSSSSSSGGVRGCKARNFSRRIERR